MSDGNGVLVIVGTDIRGLGHPPVVSVDAASRPDVADMLRVLLTDGTGHAVTEWQPLDDGRHIRLRVHIERPAFCRFDLIFDAGLESHRSVLRAATKTPLIGIVTEPLIRGTVARPFTVPCDSEHIAELLEERGIGSDDD